MKMIKSLVAAAILSTAAVGVASAAITVDQITSSADVRVVVKDGVATLTGNVESNFDRVRVGKAAAKIDGVTEVRNLIFFSS